MSKTKSIVVIITDESLKNIHLVADKLTSEGMKVEQVLPITGVISGSCPAAKKAALQAIEGVHSVEDEVPVQLAPPDSDIQ